MEWRVGFLFCHVRAHKIYEKKEVFCVVFNTWQLVVRFICCYPVFYLVSLWNPFFSEYFMDIFVFFSSSS